MIGEKKAGGNLKIKLLYRKTDKTIKLFKKNSSLLLYDLYSWFCEKKREKKRYSFAVKRFTVQSFYVSFVSGVSDFNTVQDVSVTTPAVAHYYRV